MIMMDLLGRGAHASPRRGCNVLELASVLAGERWSTSPQSVHPALAAAADMVNDLMSDERRRLLAPLAPWLPGTSTADPLVWPAVTGVCIRAALAPVSGHGQPRLLANLDAAQNWLAEASSPRHGRQCGFWARRRDRRRARRAICSALVALAISENQGDVDAVLCQVLVDCINACRRLAGEDTVDPRLPLADCPQRLSVEPRLMWSPGCDWMEVGYRPVSASASSAPAHRTHTKAESPAACLYRPPRGMDKRRAMWRRPARKSAPS